MIWILSGYHPITDRLSSGYGPIIVWLFFGYLPVNVWLFYEYCPVIVQNCPRFGPVTFFKRSYNLDVHNL